MKTQIIQLELHDDTLSVRDKMDWSQTPRVLLVWPEKGKVLRNRLDLILLERYCSSHGSQLALLTNDPEVIFQGRQAGIPVFHSRREAQLQPWGKSFREFQRQDLQRYIAENPPPESLVREPHSARKKLPIWVRIPVFALGVFSVLAISATLLPRADIVIQPNIKQKDLVLSIQAQPGVEQISISGIVPGRSLEITVSDQISKPASGTTTIPSHYASGQVIFTNLGQVSVNIPENTTLSTGGEDPILFRTLQDSETPPGAGEQCIVEIEALYPGTTGNVAEGQIQQINLAAGAELSVTNPEPISGGTDMLIPAPDQYDRFQLSQEMDQLLKEKALDQAILSLQPDDILLSSDQIDPEILEESYTPSENSPGDILWLDRTNLYRFYYAASQDLKLFSSKLVMAQYQDSNYVPHPESITINRLTAPVLDQHQNYTWEVQISWEETLIAPDQEIIQWVLGENTAHAREIIGENLALSESVDITIHPSWWPRIPILPFRIQIIQKGSNSG